MWLCGALSDFHLNGMVSKAGIAGEDDERHVIL